MKNLLYILLLVPASLMMGCNKPVDHFPAAHGSLDGTWEVVSYRDNGNQQIITRTSSESGLDAFPAANILVTLRTHQDTLTLHGHTVTNEVSGTFVLKTGDSLDVISFGGSKVGEPHWGQWFWDAMNSAGVYHLTGNRLLIDYHQREKTIVLQPQSITH